MILYSICQELYLNDGKGHKVKKKIMLNMNSIAFATSIH